MTSATISGLSEAASSKLAIHSSQRSAATVVGVLYLVTMATSIFGDWAIRLRVLVPGDAARTAANITANEGLFRLGVVMHLLTIVGVIVLLWALYVVLKPVHPNLALLAAFFRIGENTVAAMGLVWAFLTLRLLAGTSYLQAFEQDQLQVFARVLLGGHGAALGIAFVFLGTGSALFSYLWWKSGYIPRPIAVWGMFSSLVLAGVGLLTMIFPEIGSKIGLTYMMPMFVYEVGLGIWLLIRGLRTPSP